MKADKKNNVQVAPVVRPGTNTSPPIKQTSGDKEFDNAIDKMLKKPLYQPIK